MERRTTDPQVSHIGVCLKPKQRSSGLVRSQGLGPEDYGLYQASRFIVFSVR